MAKVFLPTLLSGQVARYPVTQTVNAMTDMVQFVNGSEQRWRAGSKLLRFELTYSNVNSYDLGVMLDFFISKKGMFVDSALSNTFCIVLNGVETDWCTFEQDDFTEVEDRTNLYSFKLKIRQLRSN